MVMLMVLGVMFLGSVQPIMMVVSLVFITLFYSYYVMSMMGSFWFSYALIMVMLSGVLVIFIYMASLIPNEEFEIYGMIFFVIFMFIFLFNNMDLVGDSVLEWVSLKLWGVYLGGFMLFMGLMLFVVMLMVVWISSSKARALRVI